MTIKQAEKQGLEFTGFYRRHNDRAEVRAEAKRLRTLGIRALMVYNPGTRRDGYSVYADPSYEELDK